MTRPTAERTIARAEPNITLWATGRLLGRVIESTPRIGLGTVLTLRNLVLLAVAPIAAVLYLALYWPGYLRRYRLTDQGVLIERGLLRREAARVDFAEFDDVVIEVAAGQAWSCSGDLVLRNAGREVLRLPGLHRPDGFRRTILDARRAVLAVR